MILAELFGRILNQRTRYVVANVVVAAMTFVRNFAFMKKLGLSDLGQIALAQTLIMLIAFLQFGLINGGYRIYASRDADENKKVNNLILIYIAFLAIVLVVFCMAGARPILKAGITPKTLYFGLAAGIATLTSNWMNNCLIADEKLGLSNKVNLLAAGISLTIVLLTNGKNLEWALVSLLIQPLSIVIATQLFHEPSRPSKFWVSLVTLRKVISLGFVPFLGGLLALLSLQLERWSIISALGSEQLGRFYIVILYSSIFTLVPASLLNVYYPKAMRKYEESDIEALLEILKRHSFDLFRYIILAVAITVIFMKFVVLLFLPKFLGTLYFVYIALPGFIVTSMCDILALYYNALKRLRPLLWYGLIGLLSYGALLLALLALNRFSLASVVIVKSSSAIIAGVFLYFMHRFDLIREKRLA